MENGSKSILGRGTDHANALWQKSHGKRNMKEASGTPVERAAKRREARQKRYIYIGQAEIFRLY